MWLALLLSLFAVPPPPPVDLVSGAPVPGTETAGRWAVVAHGARLAGGDAGPVEVPAVRGPLSASLLRAGARPRPVTLLPPTDPAPPQDPP